MLYNPIMTKQMPKQKREEYKAEFKQALTDFVETLKSHVSTKNDQWTIKDFIDVFQTRRYLQINYLLHNQ